MKSAFTVWGQRLSPVFDSADTLLIVEIKNKKIIKKTYKAFNPKTDNNFTENLIHLGIKVLICGAITQLHASLIEDSTIKLIPFIGGNVNDIIKTYAVGDSLTPTFLMPGCREVIS